jgi:transcriptional regulator with XRE-family HTH domain
LINGEKIDYLIKLLRLTNTEIAKKLEVPYTSISHWKQDNGRLKKVHIYAFAMAYSIPVEIFNFDDSEDNIFDTEEKIKKCIDSNKKDKEWCGCSKNDKIIKILSANRYYCYNFSSDKQHIDILENEIIIKDSYIVENFNNIELIREGNIDINELQSTIKLKSKKVNTCLNITFDNNRVLDNIFYAMFSTKTMVLRYDMMGVCIFSKSRLPLYVVKHLLQNREKSQFIVEDRLKNRILNNLDFFHTKSLIGQTPYDEDIVLTELVGKWYLYTYQTNRKHYFEIDSDLKVKWYSDDIFQEDGVLTINSFQSIIESTDKRGYKSYFIFDTIDRDLRVCSFLSQTDYNHRSVMGVGIFTKNKISQNRIDKFLISEEKSRLNTFVFKDKIVELL